MLIDEELLPQLLAVAAVDVESPGEVSLDQQISSTRIELHRLIITYDVGGTTTDVMTIVLV
jgi:hypothetical protein